MDVIWNLQEDFGITEDFVVAISSKRLSCLVPTSWIESHSNSVPDVLPAILNTSYSNAHKSLAALLLARTTSKQHLEGFTPVTVNIVKKQFKVVESLVEERLCLGSVDCSVAPKDLGNAEIRSHLEDLQNVYFQKEAKEKFPSAYDTRNHTKKKLPTKPHDQLVADVLTKLYGRIPILSEKYSASSNPTEATIFEEDNKSKGQFRVTHPSLYPVYFVAETSSAFFLFQPFVRHTLADVVAFSPLKLSECTHKMFVFTEILMAVQHLHSIGLNICNLALSDFSVDEILWIKIISLDFDNLFVIHEPVEKTNQTVKSLTLSSRQSTSVHADVLVPPRYLKATLTNLSQIAHHWMHGEVSNLDYLLILNKLAGRNIDEPNHHPLLPWVLDFSDSSGRKFRDLTRSKYRLNKGDQQLDLTFDTTNPESMMSHPNQTPFHVSDFLSDISYYVYVARKTPRDVLCRLVRPKWQPNHYPTNIGRLYEWTPDECIPAFYIDSSIFESLHEDLPDLQLPMWASCPREFVDLHRAALESPEVSKNLHQWIDLTFGYRVSGLAAMESKNVCLQLVDKHTCLMNHGVVQLFRTPHPIRRVRTIPSLPPQLPFAGNESFSDDLEEEAAFAVEENEEKMRRTAEVSLKRDDIGDLLSDLQHFERIFNFCIQEAQPFEKNLWEEVPGAIDAEELRASVVSRDMQTIGCLAVELFCGRILSSLSPDRPSLKERCSIARNLATRNLHEFPYFIQRSIRYLLNLPPSKQRTLNRSDSYTGAALTYPAVNWPNDLPPPTINILLAPQTGLLNTPNYINSLYHCLQVFHALVPDIKSPRFVDVKAVESQVVRFLSQFLKRYFASECTLVSDAVETVIFPYVKILMGGSLGKEILVSSTRDLFFFTSRSTSDEGCLKAMLSMLKSIFGLNETCPSFASLYHRLFISQVIVVFKLKVFLKHFATLLVEATSGFKNFSEADSPQLMGMADPILSDYRDVVDSVAEADEVDDDEKLHEALKNMQSEDFCQEQGGILLDGDMDTDDGKSGCPSSVSDDDISNKSDILFHSTFDDNLLAAKDDEGEEEEVYEGSAPTDRDAPGGQNISGVARDTVNWLSSKLGPVLTAKYISRNLLRMLVVCYMPPQQIEPISPSEFGFSAIATNKYVVGDRNAAKIVDCLIHIASEYGEQVILIQYFQHIKELVGHVTQYQVLSSKNEGYIISSITLLLILLPHLSITSLIDSLQILETDIFIPTFDLLSSTTTSFSATPRSSRSFAAFRLVDVMATISKQLGFDMTRCKIMNLIKRFFDGFKIVEKEYCGADESLEKTSDPRPQSEFPVGEGQGHSPRQEENKEVQSEIMEQLKITYNSELAHVAYITFCKLAGGICVEQNLDNDSFIRGLCVGYNPSHSSQKIKASPLTSTKSDDPVSGDVVVEGNQIVRLISTPGQQSSSNLAALVSKPTDGQPATTPGQKSRRLLRGDWLSYWEHEVGFGDKKHGFNMKQIKLQTFKGHSSGVRHLVTMDCENSFISAGKDHTVKLWSVKNMGDDTPIVPCEATYSHHKKSVSSLIYIDSLKHVASSDGNVHIWNPFNMALTRKVASLKSALITVLASSPTPSAVLLASANDSVVRLIDCRVGKFVHYLKTSPTFSGNIRSMSVSDNGCSLAVGFSTGIISTLDLRSGGYLTSWRAHDSEVVEMKILDNNSILSFSFDVGANVWSLSSGKQLFSIKSVTEAAHWINYFEGSLVFGCSSNKVTICPQLNARGEYSSVKLKSDLIKGNLSSLALLPLNHLFLLASDSGDITLVA